MPKEKKTKSNKIKYELLMKKKKLNCIKYFKKAKKVFNVPCSIPLISRDNFKIIEVKLQLQDERKISSKRNQLR